MRCSHGQPMQADPSMRAYKCVFMCSAFPIGRSLPWQQLWSVMVVCCSRVLAVRKSFNCKNCESKALPIYFKHAMGK